MKVVFWNSRGIGRKSFWQEIDTFCKIERIQIFVVAETKTKIPPNEQNWRKAGFDNLVWSPAVGRAGGLMALWKEHQLLDFEITIFTP